MATIPRRIYDTCEDMLYQRESLVKAASERLMSARERAYAAHGQNLDTSCVASSDSALKEDGIMVYQHGSPFYDEDELACRSMHRKAFRSFPISRVYQAHIPTCPSGYWLFGFASKKYHPIKDFKPREWDALNIETWYYTTHLHMGAFMLPKYVEDLLKEEEK